ncbi:MAG TPA: hypothetical protein VMB73_21065 [Acetobacteraceae bacterium]|nr:hypothetical protein [Acetobacteraceae bacterium]
MAVLSPVQDVRGGPIYATSGWNSARRSMRRLAAPAPEPVVTGRGGVLDGPVAYSAREAG